MKTSLKLLLIAFCVFTYTHTFHNKEDASILLKKMLEEDQQLRKEALKQAREFSKPLSECMQTMCVDELNKQHIITIKKIINLYGWPKLSEFDEESCAAAWIIVQHTDDIEFQKKSLELMQELPSHEINLSWIAYLYDRIQTNQSKPQRYATQINDEGISYEIENPEEVDKRRLAMGLKPLEDYIKLCKQHLNIK